MIQKNILKPLDLEERKIAIELLPQYTVVDYIKKNSKKIPEVNGLRLDVKSQRLLQMIPNILLKRVEQSDKMTTMFIDNILKEKVTEVYRNIDEKVGKTEFVQSVFKNEEEENYIQALEFLMEKIELTSIMVFLKLSGIELKEKQQKVLEQSMDLLKLKKEIKEQTYDELNSLLEVKYRDDISRIEENHRNIIRVQRSKYEEAQQQIKKQEELIYQGQEKVKEFSERCGQHNKEIDCLKKTIQSIEDKYEKKVQELNRKFKDKEGQLKLVDIKNSELEQDLKKKEVHIIEMQKSLEARYQEFSTQYLARWKVENQSVLDKKEQLEVEIEHLENQYKGLKKSIEEITMEKEEARERLNRYNETVKNFLENIDETIIQSALEETMIKIKLRGQATNTQNQIKPYIKQAIKGNNIQLCDDIEDLIANIGTNFAEVGIRDKDDNYSDYIISILAARRVPLVVGYGTRNIVRAISSAYAGEMPEIISLPSGFNDVEKLNSLYYTTEAKVVLIEGVIGQLNESVILPLLRDYVEDTENDKLLFITCEDMESIKLLPAYLLEYMALVQMENIRPKINPKYIYSDGKKALQAFKNELTNIDEEYSKMQRLLRRVNFSIGYIMTRTIILAYIHLIRDIQKSIECLMLGEIKWIGQYYEVGDQIEENVVSSRRDFSIEIERAIVGG